MKTLELPQSWRDRALILAGDDIDEGWLTAEELRTAERFHLEKRRIEWKASRIAARQLAMQRGEATPAFVSFSHSRPYAGAAIDEVPIGIDVQTVRPIRDAALHLFLTEREAGAVHACGLPDAVIHFWSAKEAEWKRQGGAIETLKRVPLHLQAIVENGLRFDGVDTVRIGDVVVALTRRTS
ncbi:MAG TPA: 4'-phosphopantetheinyl transferase superfamily protein [Thermoanaerobaculia bacterium]|nr:4'-phosphopantetheinyl transferase superfamily protein [Thermoanaerobaculia bacterium]